MSELYDQPGAGELIALPDALRALPPLAPQASAWPELATKLAATATAVSGPSESLPATSAAANFHRMRRYGLPAAVAAAAMLAVATVALVRVQAPATTSFVSATQTPAAASYGHDSANPSPPTTAPSPHAAEGLAALQSRSRALEHWLRDNGTSASPQSARDLAACAELEDMIGLVDVQLGEPDTADALPLWRRRVALLEDLSMLRYGASLRQYSAGLAAAEMPVSSPNGAAAGTAPVTWNN